MQSAFKICFWFSIGLSILSFFVLGDATGFYLVAAGFAFPGIFTKSLRYRIAAIVLFCTDMLAAYGAHQEEKTWELHVREVRARMENKT